MWSHIKMKMTPEPTSFCDCEHVPNMLACVANSFLSFILKMINQRGGSNHQGLNQQENTISQKVNPLESKAYVICYLAP